MVQTSCFVISEAGVNHNGDLDKAFGLVEASADAEADAVKFQTFRADQLTTKAAQQSQYQKTNTGIEESQQDMLRRLELSFDDHIAVRDLCEKRGVEFMSTPFDLDSATFLVNELGVTRMKVGSGDLTNGPMLLHTARLGQPIILSTGMGSLADIEAALGVLAFGLIAEKSAAPSTQAFREALTSREGRAAVKRMISVLHCVTDYPAQMQAVNLRAMNTISDAFFGIPVGYSDHTLGITIPIAAVARGACVIEKHITLSRDLPGPDHRASLEPAEFTAMVQGIRDVESALGDGAKLPHVSEVQNIAVARRSLTVSQDVKDGEAFTADNLGTKRPGTGISPMLYWDYLGREATRDYEVDELVER